MNTFIGLIMFLAIMAIVLIIYFIPTIVAKKRNHKDLLAIFLLNFCLGISFIGWVVALVWAVKADCAKSSKK